jgi:L-iditol 2-dehydrogenase
MESTMNSFVLTGINQMKMVQVPKPQITEPGQVLIRMAAVGVCGSDIHYFTDGKIGSQVVEYPFPVGHEGSGIVEEVGPNVTTLTPGDRVAIDPAMPCFECDQCKAGRFHTCRKLKFLGCPGQADGCLSEYIVMPASSCFKLEDWVSFDEAVISEPLAIGYYAIKLAGSLLGKTIGILGFGPIGMSVLLPAQAEGAFKIYVTDKINERLAVADQCSATWTGNPDETDVVKEIVSREPLLLDIIFECCGKQEAVDQAIKLLKPGGKLMLIGIPEFERWSFPSDDFRRKEIAVQNVRRQNECTHAVLDLITNKTLDVNPMITHHFPFEKTDEAFELVAAYKDGVMKAMINFDQHS